MCCITDHLPETTEHYNKSQKCNDVGCRSSKLKSTRILKIRRVEAATIGTFICLTLDTILRINPSLGNKNGSKSKSKGESESNSKRVRAEGRSDPHMRVVGTRAGTLRAASSLEQQVFMTRASLNTHSLNSLPQFPVFIGMYENSLYCIESITSPNFPYLLMNLHLTISTAIHAVDDNQAA